MPAYHDKDSEHKIASVDQIVATVTATGAVGSSVSGFGGITNLIPALVVTGYTGLTNITVKLQQSQDGSNWFDITNGAFTQLTGNGSQQLTALAGPFDEQIRAFATVTGTGSCLVTVELQSSITDYAN